MVVVTVVSLLLNPEEVTVRTLLIPIADLYPTHDHNPIICKAIII